ncbi:cut8 [Apiospora phragmitis]|uniref:Tethering factor for nuclear proteasome STS1 n=1 Tax=Apiospora phragmitis TaxID=2905665 RepID=A0ABR1VQM9_9PEZI
MNVLLSPQPSFLPHQHNSASRRSPTRSMSPFQHSNMSSNRKRKAEDDGDEILLETLDAASLRMVLQKICERQPEIGEEVVKSAPKPSVPNALQVLEDYQQKMRAAFPYGDSSSDYTYYRVKAPMVALMDALADFTPQYLPPNETQANVSLQYLDGATKVIHNLPEWESHNYRHHKENAYDEISRAWALVINEAAKRGGGFVLHTGGWDQILSKHNQQSGGRLGTAMNAMAANVGWVGGGPSNAPQEQQQQHSILNELLSGNYGAPFGKPPMLNASDDGLVKSMKVSEHGTVDFSVTTYDIQHLASSVTAGTRTTEHLEMERGSATADTASR